jgi:PPM family protein phosphatase
VTGLFQRLFGHPKQAEREATIPIQPMPEISIPVPQPTPVLPGGALEPPQLVAACAQSVGLQRDHNEDSFFILTGQLNSDQNPLTFGLYIVADGMGGHRNGELASGTAVRTMAGYVVRNLYAPLLTLQPGAEPDPVLETMSEGVQEAQGAILRDVPGGGTTLTAVLVLGEQLTIAHVGDSRAYLLSTEGNLEPITRDHSLVKRLVELGQITVEEAAIHPQRNVLYRALGLGEPFDADVTILPLPHSSTLLLCSDGLWGVVPEPEITRIIQSSTSLQAAGQALVKAANEAGGPDNITVILVRMPD